jgi:hypothetical protein
MSTRTLSVPIHGAVEVFLAPAIMAAPFFLDFGVIATAVAVVIGAVMLGSALSLVGERRSVPLSAHAGFDYAVAYVALIGAIAAAIAGDEAGTVFLVGVGAAQALLTATTRFSLAPRGA